MGGTTELPEEQFDSAGDIMDHCVLCDNHLMYVLKGGCHEL